MTEHDNWIGGDGVAKKKAMLINGGFFGLADWGDTIRVTVTSNLGLPETCIHWHGIRMLNNNVNDGANGITECPIPPVPSGVLDTSSNPVLSRYHSHFSSQYANGVPTKSTVLRRCPTTRTWASSPSPTGTTAPPTRSNTPSGAAPPSDSVLFNGKGKGPITDWYHAPPTRPNTPPAPPQEQKRKAEVLLSA
ncbi:hypothetical protein OQA88_13252 [Cercophora sp. LCS_1]